MTTLWSVASASSMAGSSEEFHRQQELAEEALLRARSASALPTAPGH
jgi:hypothetical protein